MVTSGGRPFASGGPQERLVWWGRPVLVASILALVAACGSSDDSADSAAAGSETTEPHHDHGDHDDGEGHDRGDDGLAELMGDHEHEVSDEPLDPETQELLDAQLEATGDLVDAYPTLADAEADGWIRAGQFSPGLGTHYIKSGETFTIRSSEESEEGEEVQPLLMFDGLGPESPIAGLMLLAMGESEPDGFAGPNDYWHRHTNVCLIQREDVIEAPFGADVDDVTEEMCSDVGGSYLDVTTHMLHVWTVSGYESEMGVFGGVNPEITCPDGSYHMVPIEELDATTTESVCLN